MRSAANFSSCFTLVCSSATEISPAGRLCSPGPAQATHATSASAAAAGPQLRPRLRASRASAAAAKASTAPMPYTPIHGAKAASGASSCE